MAEHYDEGDQINYKQWTTVDRCTLETIVADTDTFIDNLVKRAEKLIAHHYVSKSQAYETQRHYQNRR